MAFTKPNFVSSSIASQVSGGRRPEDLVFPRSDGGYLRDETALKFLHRVCDELGMRRVGRHQLRHTFATGIVARHHDTRTAQLLLGHSSVAVTERYLHVVPELLREAVVSLDRPLAPSKFGHPVGSEAPEPVAASPSRGQ